MSKILHALIAIVFIAFAIVQYNDPDGWKWMIVYLLIAVIPLHKAFGKHWPAYTIGIATATVLGLVFNADQVTSWIDAGKPDFIDYEPTNIQAVEDIREYLGICISAVLSVGYVISDFVKSRG
ncbi:transmembrane 220 family protein [Saprospiraceae bacterium]|nr:transmembrane 220 family protein [Saprospiraceae bacterium]